LNKNKGVELIMDVTNKKKVIKSLEKNEDDFSLVSVILSQLNLNKVQLMENKLYLVGGRKIITDKKISKNKMFEQYPLIYREEGSAPRKAMENFIKENNLPSHKKWN
jgi:hypothetical protein